MECLVFFVCVCHLSMDYTGEDKPAAMQLCKEAVIDKNDRGGTQILGKVPGRLQ